jgi:hypothetical protein
VIERRFRPRTGLGGLRAASTLCDAFAAASLICTSSKGWAGSRLFMGQEPHSVVGKTTDVSRKT